MATVNKIDGTTGNDVIAGTGGPDSINGGAGDDTIYGGEGNDTLAGDAGNDLLYGGGGDDGFFGGGGNDTIYGQGGNDTMYGDGGDDYLDGAAGTNVLNGGTGNDTFVHRVGEGVDTINAGAGTDKFIIELNSAQLTDAVRADFATLSNWLSGQLASAGSTAALAAQTTGSSLTLSALGLTINTVEQVTVLVDGKTVPLSNLFNQAPIIDAAQSTVDLTVVHGKEVAGTLAAKDLDGDTLTYSVLTGPGNGAVVFTDDKGHFTYTSGGAPGADSFVLQVSDGHGHVVTQEVKVDVTNAGPVADAVATVDSSEDTTIVGTVPATDADGDALSWTVDQGPDHGELDLDPTTGAYVYTPNSNFSGSDAFSVLVDDGHGGQTLQQVQIGISAVVDAPKLDVSTPVVVTPTLDTGVFTGGTGNDVMDADVVSQITVGLDITAALVDRDGSESLAIVIGNVPSGGTLSAGHDNGDGTWTLTSADLLGLTLTATVSESFQLSVDAVTTETDGSTAHTLGSIEVDVAQSPNVFVGNGGDDTLSGGGGADTIYGNSGADVLNGNGGADTLYGGKDNDVLSGGAGDDTLYGNSGNDTISDGHGNDVVNGGSGDDVLVAGEGDDNFIGGSGFDTLDFSGSSQGMVIDASLKSAFGMGNDIFSGIEKIIGSGFADSYKGSSGVDNFDGGAGNDMIRGLGGNDTLRGGGGNDTFAYMIKDVVSGGTQVGVDTIMDFGAGDRLDLHDFLKSAKYKAIGEYVHVRDTAEGSMLSVKYGGNFYDVAMLHDVHGMTPDQMLAGGMILT